MFLYSTAPRPALRLILQSVLGSVLPGVKRERREADHSPLTSAEVKYDGAIPPFLLLVRDMLLN
jgi:hypothetical protein